MTGIQTHFLMMYMLKIEIPSVSLLQQDLQLNRVVIEETVDVGHSTTGSRPKKKTKSYDLSCQDKFWSSQKGNPFPEVAEAVQSELETYRASEDEVKKLKAAMGLEGEDEGAISMLSDTTAKLTSAVR